MRCTWFWFDIFLVSVKNCVSGNGITRTAWMPSISTAQRPPFEISFFTGSMSLSGKKAASKVSLMGATILGLSVTFTAAEVLP